MEQANTPVHIEYKHINNGKDFPGLEDWQWQAIVWERGIRDNGTCYPSVVAIAENPDKKKVQYWARREGYRARHVEKLDLSDVQTSLF